MLRDIPLWLRPAGWPLLSDAARRRTLPLAWAAIFAQVVFVGGLVVVGALEPHYSAVRQYISELGRNGAAHPWVYAAVVGIWGLGFIALALAVAPSLRTRPWPLAMPSMFVLAGICAILTGLVRMDCSVTTNAVCKSRQAADALSWHHYAHHWLTFGIYVSVLLTGFVFARAAWPGRLARLVLGGAVVLLIAWIFTYVLPDSVAGYQGLQERLWALVAQLWALLCAIVLILEGTLKPGVLQTHEVSTQRQAPGGRDAVGFGPA